MASEVRRLTVLRPYCGDNTWLTMNLVAGESVDVGELVVLDGGSVQDVYALVTAREGAKVRLALVTQPRSQSGR